MEQLKTTNFLKEDLNTQDSEQQKEVFASKPQKLKPVCVVLVILAILILGSVIVGGILLWSRNKKGQGHETKEEEIKKDSEEVILNEYEGWKIYENKRYGYSLKYPSDWMIDTTTAECDDINSCVDASLILEKNNYKFQINIWVGGRGGMVCVFNDSATNSDIKAIGSSFIELGEPFQIVTVDGVVLRRNKKRLLGDPSFRVCQVDSVINGKYSYKGYTLGGEILYYTPESVENDLISILDKITASITTSNFKSTDPYEGWKIYENPSSFFKFSVKIPIDAYACSCGTSHVDSCSDEFSDCKFWGITLENPNSNPKYGILLKYTQLPEQNKIDAAFEDEYKNYEKSDIDFGADFQVMVRGSDSIGNYTKYYFTMNGSVYMPQIYTNYKNENYLIYHLILESWKF